jgi:hypothetical protein
LLSGSDFETQAVINAGGIPALKELLHNRKREIRREACWALSNIAAGNTMQIQALLNENLFSIVRPFMQSEQSDFAKDAIYFIVNIFNSGSSEHIKQNSSIGILQELCHLLDKPIVGVSMGLDIVNSIQCILLQQQALNNLPAFFEQGIRDVVLAISPIIARGHNRLDMFPIYQALSHIFNTYIAPYDNSELGLRAIVPLISEPSQQFSSTTNRTLSTINLNPDNRS